MADKQMTSDEKAVDMYCRTTGAGKIPATESVKKLESHERLALVAAYDNGKNAAQAKDVIDHAATRQALQERERIQKEQAPVVVEPEPAAKDKITKPK